MKTKIALPVPIPRGPGRPRVDEPLTSISVRVPLGAHDRLIHLANERNASLSHLVRELLILRLR